MTLSWDEYKLISALAREFKPAFPRQSPTFGLKAPPDADGPLAKFQEFISFSNVGPAPPAHELTELDTPIRLLLTAFAHARGIDTSDEFWEFRAVAQAVLEHPSFRSTKPKPLRGRPSHNEAVSEANTQVFWICANRLRAILEIHRGHKLSHEELAEEMARRDPELPHDESSWTNKQLDAFENKRDYHYRMLRYDKTQAYVAMLTRHNFELPSGMRLNSTYNAQRQSDTFTLHWAPSQTELAENPEWKSAYKRIRKQQLEEARKTASR